MSYIDAFNKGRTMARQITGQNPLGSGAAIGSSLTIGKKKRPQTMQEWKTFADGLTRRERDQLYPGMHIDLIPAYEVITGGDPNWGAEASTSVSAGTAPSRVPTPTVAPTSSLNAIGNGGAWLGSRGGVSFAMTGKQEELDRLRADLEAYAAAASQMRGEIGRLERELRGLNLELNTITFTQERRTEIEAEIRRKEVELEQLEEDLEALYDAYNKLEKEIAKLEEEIRNGSEDDGEGGGGIPI